MSEESSELNLKFDSSHKSQKGNHPLSDCDLPLLMVPVTKHSSFNSSGI